MKLAVTVQLASSRRGVPHVRSLARWANAAADLTALRGRAVPRVLQQRMALTIRIIGAAESRQLNRTWRGKDKPTNVLSFPADAPGPADGSLPELGDLAICKPVVDREAREQGKAPAAHWAHMVVHGVLHLMGYDHEDEHHAVAMESRESKILGQFGYADPYG